MRQRIIQEECMMSNGTGQKFRTLAMTTLNLWKNTKPRRAALALAAIATPARGKRNLIAQGLFIALLVTPLVSNATPIIINFVFSNGTTADADEVNSNFDQLVLESNAQDLRLAAIEATSGDLAAHEANANAHHFKTVKFAELIDIATDAQIPGLIARDAEVFPIVLGADGSGSGLNADLLDGISSTTFALESEVFPIVLSQDGSGSGLSADFLDGWDQGSFLRSNATDAYTFGTMSFNVGTTLNLNGTTSIGQSSGLDDDQIFFDANLERIFWDDSETRFQVTDGFGIDSGPLQVGPLANPTLGYNSLNNFGLTADLVRGPQMGNTGDLFVRWDLEIVRRMPAGAIEDQYRMTLDSELFAQVSEMHVHEMRVDGWRDQGD
jgi:hypothetical protein